MKKTTHQIKDIIYALYKRKSTDEKERQILSLDSQKTDTLKRHPTLKVVEFPDESISAFIPFKRPTFDNLLEQVEQGKIQGILAWHPDRLARNAPEAAKIIYLLDTGKLKDLKFANYHFENTPEGKMMLQITMAQSKYSSDKLSIDVKRGIDKKANMGWRPGHAPLGYRNTKKEDKGKQYIYNDPEYFDRVKELFQKMLTGNYTVPKLLEYANETLSIKMPPTKNKPAREMHLSELYRILTNPFYYGWYEWPDENGIRHWTQGKHEPMITDAQFDHIQYLLGRKGRPRPKTHKFAFTGIMTCPCGASITAEEKFKKQKNGNLHHYIYYHCTRKINKNCLEKSVELDEFNRQIDDILSKLGISERFHGWALAHLHKIRKQEAVAHEDSLKADHKRLEAVVKQLDNVMIKFTSPENADGSLISDNDLKDIKGRLSKEKATLEAKLANTGEEIDKWVELSERTFNFARYARIWFAKGTIDEKRAIFACLDGSNPLLKDQKVVINLRKHFKIIFDGLPEAKKELERLEPLINGADTKKIASFEKQFPILSG